MSATINRIAEVDSILEQWYVSCDPNMTGQVRSNDLVEKIKEYVTGNHEARKAKILMNDLTERLDNRKDNCYVDMATFVKAAKDWYLMMLDETDKENESIFANSGSISLNFPNGSNDMINQILDNTFGSIEAINGASLNVSKPTIAELHTEMDEMRSQLKVVNDEKAKLLSQLNSTEDSNTHLTSQNQELHKRLRSLKESLDKALKYQSELDELRTLADSREEESKILEQSAAKNSSRVSELVNENMELQNKLEETMEQLTAATEDLREAKKSHNSTFEKMKDENEKIKEELDQTLALKEEFERRIEELQSEMTNIRESQFFQRGPSSFDNGESEFMSPSYDDPFTRMIEERADGPSAISTPSFKKFMKSTPHVRGSISDEIKILGMKDDNPFCEKSGLHNESAQASVPKTTCETGTQTAYFSPESDDEDSSWNASSIVKRIACVIGFVLVVFTFFGAIEFEDGRKLLPILCLPGFPEPMALLSIRNGAPEVW